MSKYDIKCDNCGKFISYKQLCNGEASNLFIPDSEVSYEENVFRCKTCTESKGKPVSSQFGIYDN